MKNSICILILLLGSQLMYPQSNKTYEELWTTVQKLESEALTKSALKVVQTIASKAKTEQNKAQTVKTLLFTSKYALTLEEDAQLNIVTDFREAISGSETPVKNILESYLANLYWQYFQVNRYQFYERTQTAAKVDSTDFRTWDLNTLFYEVTTYFDRSLEQAGDLQKLKTSEFAPILIPNKHIGKYRPTLFDLLAHTALDFYKSGENSITRPATKFEIADPEILCQARHFINRTIPMADKTSLQARALILYQELIRFHIGDTDPMVLVDTDIDRLTYTYQNAVFEDKAMVYEEALKNSASFYQGIDVSTLYEYETAILFNTLAEDYQPELNEANRWKRRDALRICEQAILAHPQSLGAQKCMALKGNIKEPDMHLTVESHIPVAKPSKLLIRYKNQDGMVIKAYAIAQEQQKKLIETYPIEKQLTFIKGLKLMDEWQSDLRNEMDYQYHTMEVLIPSLENGMYVLLAMPRGGGKSFALGYTQVTDIALMELGTDQSQTFQAVNRNNGLPLRNADLTLSYQENYDQAYRHREFLTDSSGMVVIPLAKYPWTSVSAHIVKRGEEAWFGAYYIGQKTNMSPEENKGSTVYLFTDRSIYRPGQPLFFKGIAISGKQGSQVVRPNSRITMILSDVNGQTVAEQEFTTNDFGSFSGEFIIPYGGLTGIFTLNSKSGDIDLKGNTDISVEEYKRPGFQTVLNPITETYKVNDSILIKGSAIAYAGSAISGARVAYRVHREVNFPKWFYWTRPYFNNNPQEIAFGEVRTDSSGNYEIRFKALPDNNANRKDLPVFSYEVIAEVTDINGETRTANTVVSVGYHALRVQITVPDRLEKGQTDHKILIATTNLNGQSVPAKGTISFYKLKGPETILRKRPWPAPDYKSFTREKFTELFPNEAFDKEDDPLYWEKGKLVWETGFDTGKTGEIKLGNIKKWESGAYLIRMQTTDRSGQLVKEEARTILFGDTDRELADNQLFEIHADKVAYSIGETAKIRLATNMDRLGVTVYIEKGGKIVHRQVVELDGNAKVLPVPVAGTDLGGFAVNYSFSAYNSFETGSIHISVPYPDSDLDIETITFRDKLAPGTDETWSFRIKGPQGDKVAGEMLAGMYDASLDSFREHSWNFDPLTGPVYFNHFQISGENSYGIRYFDTKIDHGNPRNFPVQTYDEFDWFGLTFGYGNDLAYRKNAFNKGLSGAVPGVVANAMEIAEDEQTQEEVILYDGKEKPVPGQPADKTNDPKFGDIQIRRNLQETAFFLPQLTTDKDGDFSFSFKTPEALTKWKLQLLAHTSDLASKVRTLEAVTQKELMVIPNYPRFLREGDVLYLSTKIINMSGSPLEGIAQLELSDAVTGKDISGILIGGGAGAESTNSTSDKGGKPFKVDSTGNTQVTWQLKIPSSLQAVQFKVMAKAGKFSDGEQLVLPVLTNRMLVTETLPLWVGSEQRKTFTLQKLRNNTSNSLIHHKLTLEITSNPAWYAVQALPYLMEYPFDCNEQVFARFYANTLAKHIAGSNPMIRDVFEQWAHTGGQISNLEKNEDLKSLLIQETPWLRDAESETDQKKRIGLLFDLNKMGNEQTMAIQRLKNNQLPSGAWPWFTGGRENRYITQHIITGMGYLQKLKVWDGKEHGQMVSKAIDFLDAEFVSEYEALQKITQRTDDDHLSYSQIHYLYMRSFFGEVPTDKKVQEIMGYYRTQIEKYWTKKNLYAKGLMALTLFRMGDTVLANKIVSSLKENSITSEEMGMYWKENTNSWYWYQAPIETQSLMIAVFDEVRKDLKAIDNLKRWLLRNKQTNQWNTTKATSEAVYALLLQGGDWLSIENTVKVTMGGEEIVTSGEKELAVEAGTGYYKTSWSGKEIAPAWAEVTLQKKGQGIAWGALYWQYFEDLDKIAFADTPLKIKKKLFLRKYTTTGEELTEITSDSKVFTGDLVRVRMEITVDRSMEFIHLKDMRASGLEAVTVLSGYTFQDGLGYYESTRDASTNFFFDVLPKGVFVLEYDLRANNSGEFSNGITTIQSMYAPEFSSHSEGTRITIGTRN